VTDETTETGDTHETSGIARPGEPKPAEHTQPTTSGPSPASARDTHLRPATYAATHPERPAVVTSSGATVTFAELEARSCRFAQTLFAHGLRPGDHVAILLPNDDRTHEVVFGAQRSGLYYTMVNTHLTAEEAAYIVNDCGAHTLVTSSTLRELAAEMVPLTPAVDLRLMVGHRSDVAEAHVGYDELVSQYPSEPLAHEEEGFPMLYSSGTTGHPKGVRRPLSGEPFGTYATLNPMLERIMGFAEGDVYLSPAPLYHSAPLVWSSTILRMGGTLVLMERFDPEECLRLIQEHRVTHAQFVPTMFVRMLKLPDDVRAGYDVSSLRSVVHAAAPCAPEVKRRMIEWWGPIVHEYYSGTEGMGMTWIGPEAALSHPGSVGPAIWGQVHICSDDGAELPVGETGVVYFGGRTDATFEYNHDPEKTRQSFNDKGWATLWDVGHVDEEGFLYLTDRKQFMIVSGGVNIYPQEVEDVLVLHPAVADVAVFGVPEAEMGEEVKAVVQAAPGYEPGAALAAEIIAFCRNHLSHYKCPHTVDFTDQLPRGENGKLYKKGLREAYLANSTPTAS
jgi:acyl-CoA synthetase (AMP-forming)/AMP-acid ligase II